MPARPPAPTREAPVAALLLRSFAPFLFALLLLPIAVAHGGERTSWPLREVLDAIRFVESSDRDDVPDGDGGKAARPSGPTRSTRSTGAMRSPPSPRSAAPTRTAVVATTPSA